MQTVLIIIHLLVAMALVVVILLQRSEGGALGIGGSGSGLGGLFSPRGAANTLTRTTTVLGVLFFSTSLALTVLALGTQQPRSILDSPASAPAPATSAPAVPMESPPSGEQPASEPAVPEVPTTTPETP